MEVSLSPELMELLKQFLGTLGKMQSQYLIAIIPSAVLFLVYFTLMARPWLKGWRRWWRIRYIEKQNGSTVVTLIHTQPTGLLDMFRLPMISLDDSRKVMEALETIPDERPIQLILHTPGGMVIAAEQIARAIRRRKGRIEAYVPQYAMSGGTLIALACQRIHMGANAVLGPLDPQLSVGLFEQYPCASLVKALRHDNPNRDDKTIIYADIAAKALSQMQLTVEEILQPSMGVHKSVELASLLCNGNWTHDHGITLQAAKELGLPVDGEITDCVRKVAETFPIVSSVEYRKRRKKDTDEKVLRISL